MTSTAAGRASTSASSLRVTRSPAASANEDKKATRANRLPGRPRGRSLSVGEPLRAPLRLGGRPVGRRVRGPSPRCAIVAFVWVPSTLRSRPFAWSGRGRVRRRYSRRQLRPSTLRRTSRPAPFQRRGCGQPAVLLGPGAAFTGPCRSLTLSCVALRHARVGFRTARCATGCASLAADAPCLTWEPEDPRFTSPVRARWA